MAKEMDTEDITGYVTDTRVDAWLPYTNGKVWCVGLDDVPQYQSIRTAIGSARSWYRRHGYRASVYAHGNDMLIQVHEKPEVAPTVTKTPMDRLERQLEKRRARGEDGRDIDTEYERQLAAMPLEEPRPSRQYIDPEPPVEYRESGKPHMTQRRAPKPDPEPEADTAIRAPRIHIDPNPPPQYRQQIPADPPSPFG